MTRFFVPGAKDADEEEQVRTAVVQFAKRQGFDVTDRRIFRLSYRHNGQHYVAEVGKPDSLTGAPVVVMILEMRDRSRYLVCTPNRGVLRGLPILVGQASVLSITDFD